MGASQKTNLATNYPVSTAFPSEGNGLQIAVGNYDAVTLIFDGTSSSIAQLGLRFRTGNSVIMKSVSGTSVVDEASHDLSLVSKASFRIDTKGLSDLEVLLNGDVAGALDSVDFVAEGTESRGPAIGN